MKLCDPKRRTNCTTDYRYERADWIEVQELSETSEEKADSEARE
jgi:hypothetical protein